MRLKKIPIYPIYLLVGGWPTPLKNIKVSWDDDIPNIWRFPIKTGGWAYPPEKWWSSSDWIIIPTDGKIKFMFLTTNQYWIIFDPVETFPAFAILLWSSLIFTRPRSDTVNLGRPAFFWMNRWKKKDSKWEWQNSNPITKWFWKKLKIWYSTFPNYVWWPNRYGFEPWVTPRFPTADHIRDCTWKGCWSLLPKAQNVLRPDD